ncbi:XTP/dITP diphosphatase [Virgibacillus sp. DJP39]|uniref:XTP/dITP diphosphatase n=1 Tax=Virgibacillus sp. DJP39 TaxID=3409790 RepID=UPI003BB67F79
MKEVIVATKNKGKAREFAEFFAPYGIRALSLWDLSKNLPDIEETGATFEENAALKAEDISSFLKLPVVADDSGLVIDALHGSPGIYSARYAGEPKNDQTNIEKVLAELKGVPAKKRTARFVCILAVAAPHVETTYYKGICEGSISTSSSGDNGFGYDPIFIPENSNKTLAEFTPLEKNKISHRKKAIVQLDSWLKSL